MIEELAALGLEIDFMGDGPDGEAIPRHDARLVEVAERHIKSGDEADYLAIYELRGNRYRITGRNGVEQVIDSKDRSVWTVVD